MTRFARERPDPTALLSERFVKIVPRLGVGWTVGMGSREIRMDLSKYTKGILLAWSLT